MSLYAGVEFKLGGPKSAHQFRDIVSEKQLHVQLLGQPTTVFTGSSFIRAEMFNGQETEFNGNFNYRFRLPKQELL